MLCFIFDSNTVCGNLDLVPYFYHVALDGILYVYRGLTLDDDDGTHFRHLPSQGHRRRKLPLPKMRAWIQR